MCKACCMKAGVSRGKSVTECIHTDRPHYGKGLCKKCYRKKEYHQVNPVSRYKTKPVDLPKPVNNPELSK